MPISPFDIAIILISSVACLYCIVLSRRLKALQNTRNGLGATIKALSDSISAVSATTDETRYHAGELATRLARLIEDARHSCARIEDLTHQLNEAQARAELQLKQVPPMPVQAAPAPAPVAAPMPATTVETDQKLQEITALMDKLKEITEASVNAAEAATPALRPLPTQLRPRMKVV